MKNLLPLLVSLLLQSVATACLAIFSAEAIRPEPAIAVVAFAAVRMDPIAGVLAASSIGFATDLMASSPPGLHMLAFTAVYLGVQALAGTIGVTRTLSAIPLVLVGSAATRLLLTLLLALFAEGGARVGLWYAQVLSVFIDGAIAVPVWALLEWGYRRMSAEAELSWRRS